MQGSQCKSDKLCERSVFYLECINEWCPKINLCLYFWSRMNENEQTVIFVLLFIQGKTCFINNCSFSTNTHCNNTIKDVAAFKFMKITIYMQIFYVGFTTFSWKVYLSSYSGSMFQAFYLKTVVISGIPSKATRCWPNVGQLRIHWTNINVALGQWYVLVIFNKLKF